MISKKIFAERLSSLRTDRSLTQQQLGNVVGTKKQSISNWEKCISVPSLDMTSSLADYFNVSIDYLVGRTNNPKVNQ